MICMNLWKKGELFPQRVCWVDAREVPFNVCYGCGTACGVRSQVIFPLDENSFGKQMRTESFFCFEGEV